MSTGMFVIRDDGQLLEMRSMPYATEALLQQLLATHPSLIPGDQIDPEQPRKWLLVSRELGVPGEEAGADRWSLDHLFLDQDGIPTLVEVKRSSDTRIRREVVGQMLDYAANAVAYWPVEGIQAALEARCREEGLDAGHVLLELIGPETDPAVFWQSVKTNLQAGKVRLLFVADEIPAELRRIVEFLNRQTTLAEILAVEVRQFVGEGLRTIVPRVHGQTEQAQQQKRVAGQRATFQWDEGSWFAKLEERGIAEELVAARGILAWARQKGLDVEWGTGPKDGSFRPVVASPRGAFVPIVVYQGYRAGFVELRLGALSLPPLDSEEGRSEVVRRVLEIPGAILRPRPDSPRPALRLGLLGEPVRLKAFLDVLEWSIDRVRRGE